MTTEDFNDWKNLAITKEVFSSIRSREKEAVEALIHEESDLMRGFIKAYREFLNMSVEEINDA